MSSVIALTEAARRRVEGSGNMHRAVTGRKNIQNFEFDAELLLLLIVIMILMYSDANIMLLLVILYVAL